MTVITPSSHLPAPRFRVATADLLFGVAVLFAYVAATALAISLDSLKPDMMMVVAERALSGHLDSDALKGGVDTVYLGGGTPSILPAEDLARVLDACREHLALATPAPWIFLEANPEDVTADACAAWRLWWRVFARCVRRAISSTTAHRNDDDDDDVPEEHTATTMTTPTGPTKR